MGCASRLTFSWGGNPGVGSLHRLRDAVEHGWPAAARARRAHPRRHGGRLLRRAPRGLPFGVLRGYIGTDLVAANPRIRSVECPFTGERLAAVPAHQPRRDDPPRAAGGPAGQRRDLQGIVGAQSEAALAAQRADRHGRGGRRRAAAGDERDRAAALGGERRRASAPAARTRRTRRATTRATTPSTSAGTRSRASATAFIAWMRPARARQPRPRRVPRQPAGRPHERLRHRRRDDDRRRGAPAVGRLRLLRRHRPAERRVQSRAARRTRRTSC